MSQEKTLCFTLMPFGKKSDSSGKEIDFNAVYDKLIRPAIEKAGLEPIRADGEQSAGFIHKPMYERLLFCEFAVADLTFANANVFYELGIRHAIRKFTTVSIFEVGTKLPFDLAPLRSFPYTFDGEVKDLNSSIEKLSELIRTNVLLDEKLGDSPIGQLVAGYPFPDLSNIKQETLAFNDWVLRTKDRKHRIREQVNKWCDRVKELRNQSLPSKGDAELQACVDAAVQIEHELDFNGEILEVVMFLISSYRTMEAWGNLAELIDRLPKSLLSGNTYLRQQLGQALGKQGKVDQAEPIFQALIRENGIDSETNGMLGSIYKRQMDQPNTFIAATFHAKAIEAYVQGFQADSRDFYPGVNALTLMYLLEEPDPRYEKLFPIVEFAVDRKLEKSPNDYWTLATRLELCLLRLDKNNAFKYAGLALTSFPEEWIKKSTRDNLSKIVNKALKTQSSGLEWMQHILDAFA